ncbi:MAG: ribosome-binding factor [Firmicutes bacterium]|nr:ribosome-binding factor [Bacillota bacterium]
MANNQRAARVADQMREEIAQLLRDLKDPRIGFVSVVKVEVANDLRHAKVFISVLGDDSVKKESMTGVQSASGHIRTELGRIMRLRYTPELHFVLDESIEHGSRIAKLLVQVQEEQAQQAQEANGKDDAGDKDEQGE